MIIKGQLYLTTDMNVLTNSLQTCRIISIGDTAPELSNMGVIGGGLLMPDVRIFSILIDEGPEKFATEYAKYLSMPEPQQLIAALIRALLNGVNILFYLTDEEFKTGYAQYLLQYLNVVFGITVGTPANPFYYDSRFDNNVSTLLYINDFMTVDEFLIAKPSGARFTPEEVSKLLLDVPPAVILPNEFEALENYYFQYKENIKLAGNKFLTPLFKKSKNTEVIQ